MESEVVYTRDTSSGRIHRRLKGPGGNFSYEADNLDDAGEYRVITADELGNADSADLCGRCFPTVNEPSASE